MLNKKHCCATLKIRHTAVFYGEAKDHKNVAILLTVASMLGGTTENQPNYGFIFF